MNRFLAPLLASIAILFLSGCYVSEVSYAGGYHRPASYGRPYYYDRGPYYSRGPYYGRSSYPYSTQGRYYEPSRDCAPSPYGSRYKYKKPHHHDDDDYDRDR